MHFAALARSPLFLALFSLLLQIANGSWCVGLNCTLPHYTILDSTRLVALDHSKKNCLVRNGWVSVWRVGVQFAPGITIIMLFSTELNGNTALYSRRSLSLSLCNLCQVIFLFVGRSRPNCTWIAIAKSAAMAAKRTNGRGPEPPHHTLRHKNKKMVKNIIRFFIN